MKKSKKLTKPAGYKPVLTVENAKTIKGEKLGWLTGILYLAPANEAGRGTLCTYASEACIAGCLNTAGRGQFAEIQEARIRKTHRLFDDRALFLACLRYDIQQLVCRARRKRMKPALRVNGTSDLAWMGLQMAAEFPSVQFYDYTKLPHAWTRTRPNYHLTFSRSEVNEAECAAALSHGLNVAVVFDVKRGKPLPGAFMGAQVIDGDQHDLRFLDDASGAVIGLRAKGKARKDCGGFVVKTSTLVQIASAATKVAA